jgi:hypothetical protein
MANTIQFAWASIANFRFLYSTHLEQQKDLPSKTASSGSQSTLAEEFARTRRSSPTLPKSPFRTRKDQQRARRLAQLDPLPEEPASIKARLKFKVNEHNYRRS